MMSVRISRDDAVAVCEALGYHTARKWNRKEFRKRLVKIAELAKDGVETMLEGELNSVFVAIVGADGEVELTDQEETELPVLMEPEGVLQAESVAIESEKTRMEGEVALVETIEMIEKPNVEEEFTTEKEQSNDDKEPKSEKKRGWPKGKAKTGKKETKQRGESGPKVGEIDPVGIRSIRNRLFYAGILLKEEGIEIGLTEALVGKLDALCGKPNLRASKSQLGLAWHVINGYLNGGK